MGGLTVEIDTFTGREITTCDDGRVCKWKSHLLEE